MTSDEFIYDQCRLQIHYRPSPVDAVAPGPAYLKKFRPNIAFDNKRNYNKILLLYLQATHLCKTPFQLLDILKYRKV